MKVDKCNGRSVVLACGFVGEEGEEEGEMEEVATCSARTGFMVLDDTQQNTE